ncbi:MAG: SH3 domain-containing protein [Thermomicrobiales bacterium]
MDTRRFDTTAPTAGRPARGISSATEPGGNEPEPTTAPTAETRYATTSLNLRSGAGTSFGVLTVIPSGAAVTVTGGQTNGYVPVTYNGTSGYASATYLSTSQSQPTPTATPDPGNSGELLVWPVRRNVDDYSGYNGGTHQNRGSSADYYYSMDIQKTAEVAQRRVNRSMHRQAAPYSGRAAAC